MKNKVLIITLLLFVLTGCTGKREINDLALVMAVGIDKGSEKNIRITVQVPRPADARGQTGAPSGNTGDPIWSAFGEGETIFEAIRDLSSFSTRRIFWAHNYVIVINEDVAKEGISDIIDFFTRNSELRMRTWVVVTPNKASKVVTTLTGLEIIPGDSINRLFRFSTVSAKAPKTQMLDLQAAYLSESSEPILARLKLVGKGASNKKPGQKAPITQIELAGAGVFKGDKLVGVLDPEETIGLLPFLEKVDSAELSLSCPNSDEKISVEVQNQRFKVTPTYKQNTPMFNVSLKVGTRVVEAGCPFTISNTDLVKELEQQIVNKYKNDINSVVTKVQKEYKSDVLELGKVFKNKYPAEWQKIGPRWEDEFPNAKVSISVQAKIEESALLFQPTKKSIQE